MPSIDDPEVQRLLASSEPSVSPPTVQPSVSKAPSTSIDDPEVQKLIGADTPFHEVSDQSGYIAAGGRTTWGDVGYGLATGWHEGVAAPFYGFESAVSATPELERANRERALAEQRAAEESRSAMTPAAQQGGLLAHPFTTLAEQAPGMAVLGGAGALGTAVAGPAGGAVAAGAVLGSQQLGSAEMRAAQQGIELTPEEKALQFGAGAVAGAAGELAGPWAGKIATSPLINLGLRGGIGAGGFAASGAAGEAVSQHAEIAAGKRAGYDTGEITRAGVEQGEYGLGFEALHLPAAVRESLRIKGEPATEPAGEQPGAKQIERSHPQTGGEATPVRGGKQDVRKDEAKAAGIGGKPTSAPTGTETQKTGPAPPADPSKADPGIVAGLAGKPITPESKAAPTPESKAEPPKPTVESQPEVAQAPSAPSERAPAAEAPAAPPAAETALPLSPQRPSLEKPPAPTPAAPTPTSVRPLPEPEGEATMREQHAALTDPNNPRQMMIYDPGMKPFPITENKWRYGNTKLADGRAVQYDTRGKDTLSKAKIKDADQAGELNKYLDYGPVSQAEAIQRSVAGEKPAVVVERTPEGVEAKAAAGTTATSPEQAAHFEETKTPGNVIRVETPAQTLAARLKAREAERQQQEQAQAQARQEEARANVEQLKREMNERLKRGEIATTEPTRDLGGRVTPEEQRLLEQQRAKQAAAPKAEAPKAEGRVLEAKGEAEERARAAQREAQEKATKELKPLKRVVKEKAEQKPGHDVKRREAAIKNNQIANEIAAKPEHGMKASDALAIDPKQAGAKGAQLKLAERLRAMVKEARDAGFKFPQRVKDRVHPEERHSPSAVLLDEARRLAERKKKLEPADFARYLEAEHELLHNGEEGYQKVLERRRAEGKEWAAEGGGATPEKAMEGETLERAAEKAPEAEAPHEAEEREAEKIDKIREAEKKAEETRAERERYEREVAEKAAEGKGTGRVRQIGESKEAYETRMERLSAFDSMMNVLEGGAKEEGAKEAEPAYRAGKVSAGFQVEKRRAIKKPDILGDLLEDEARGKAIDQHGEEISLHDTKNVKGENVTVSPFAVVKVRDVIDKLWKPERYPAELRPMMMRLANRIKEMAGHLNAHIISGDDMTKIMLKQAHGAYNVRTGEIFLNRDNWRPETALHEPFHMATTLGLRKNAELRNNVKRLQQEVYNQLTPKQRDMVPSNAWRSLEEFLTYAMTESRVQEVLKGVKISRALADDLNVPKWRKATIWEGLLGSIRKFFGMKERDTAAIEGAMAATEQAMHERDPLAQMEYEMRGEERGEERGGEYLADEVKEETPKRGRMLDRDVAKQFARDAATDIGAKWTKGVAKAGSLTQLDSIYGKIAPHVRAVGQALDKIHHAYLSGREEDKSLRIRAYIMDAQPGRYSEGYDRLTRMSTAHDIDASKPAPKPTGKIEDTQRDQFWGEAHDIYKSMPEAWQKRYRDEREQYGSWQQERGEQALKDLIKTYEPPKGSTPEEVFERARADELTDDDKEHFEQAGGLGKIKQAISQANKDETYFSSMRDGDWVMHGRFDMPDGGNTKSHAGEELPDNVREFNNESDAAKYIREDNDKGLKASVQRVYYGTGPKTGKLGRVSKLEAETQAPRGTKVTPYYRVRLERDYTDFAKSASEAKRMREAMVKAGVNENTISDPMDRRKEATWAHISSADQKLLERRIAKTDATDAERQRMVQASREAMLASQAGSLMAKHRISRRDVAGGVYGSAEALDAYSRAHHHSMARAKLSPEIDKALDAMDEHERVNRGDGDGATRSIINNEVRERVLNNTPYQAKTSKLIRNLMNYSFINFLVRPAHVLLQQMHPWVYSVPELMARHGYKAINGQRQAMRDLAGGASFGNWRMIGKGAAAGYRMARAFREKDIDRAVSMAEGWNPIKQMIGTLKSKSERDALNAMWETGHLHSAFDTSIFEGGGLDRAQAVLGQLTNAMEATNRLATALNAYRLEKRAHGDAPNAHENAIEYARRRIESSQGVYTATNISPLFKNAALRPIMQFHQMPMNLAVTLYHNMAKAAKGDVEARKTLIYQLGTAFAFGGMGGLPMDAPKLAGLASQALGGPAPSDYDDEFHRFLHNTVGGTAANIIEEGLPSLAGPFAPVLGHRMGFDSGMIFGEPKSGSPGDIMSFIAQNLGGASASTISNWIDAVHALEGGDYERAGVKALPGVLGDIAKGYREATEGVVTPGGKQIAEGSAAWGLLQMIGFQPSEVARVYQGHIQLQKAIKAQEAQDRLAKGAKGAALKKGKSVLGVSVPSKYKGLAREYEEQYQ